MRKVFVRLYVEAILTMDEGVELSTALELAEPSLHIQDDRITEIDCKIVHHEVITDSNGIASKDLSVSKLIGLTL